MKLYLAGNNKLVTDNRLQDADVELLCKALPTNFYVTSVDLRYNNINDKGVLFISNMLLENTSITELNLMSNDFGEEGARCLSDMITKNETLRSLRLNGNKIGNKGGMYFAQALQVNTTLHALDLGDTDLKMESLIALATVLNYNHHLQVLNINRPLLFSQQEETCTHFARMLKVNKGLKELHMQKNDIRDFGMSRLTENLIHNHTLTHLDLSCNRITRDGVEAFSNLLKRDTPLRVLNLGYNRIEDDGAEHLAQALGSFNTHLRTLNTGLTTLSVTHNNIKGKGLSALADSLKMNSTVEKIYVWGNNLEESCSIAFASLLENGRLEAKNVDVKPYVVDGITYLAEQDNGIQTDYYWAPSYGSNQQPELAQFVK